MPLLVALTLATACGGGGAADGGAAGADTGAAAAGVTPGATPPGVTVDSCPRFGAWQACSVEKRLRDAGFVVTRRPEPPTSRIVPVDGIAYGLGPSELAVWLFPTSAERERASAGIDAATAQPTGAFERWPRPATLIVSNNLLAVLQSENERTIERVQLALTAGLPPR